MTVKRRNVTTSRHSIQDRLEAVRQRMYGELSYQEVLDRYGISSSTFGDWLKKYRGEEADLRRDFFDGTGVYLLFSDTLGVREVPTLSGTAQNYQVVNLFCDMNPGDTYPDSLELYYYRDMAEKSAATQFLREEVLGNLPELFYPYSVLVLDSLARYPAESGSHGPGTGIEILSSMQCTALALGDLSELTQEDKESLKNSLSEQIIIDHIGLVPEEEFSAFYSYSEAYYGIPSYNITRPVESVGFLDTYVDSWTVTFNSQASDKLAFVEKMFELTEEEFRTTYADYPLVVSKMEEMVKILHKYGVNIYQ